MKKLFLFITGLSIFLCGSTYGETENQNVHDETAAKLIAYFHSQENALIETGLFLGGATVGGSVSLLVGFKVAQQAYKAIHKLTPVNDKLSDLIIMFTGATIVSCLGGISSGMLLSAIGRRQLHKIDFEESLKTLETLKKLRAIGGDDGVAANLAPYFHVQENPRKINWGLFLGGATMGLLVYLLVGSKITQYLSRESQKFLPTEVNPYSPLLIIATTLSGDLGAISSGILSLAIGRKILNKIDRAERFEARKSPSEAIQD